NAAGQSEFSAPSDLILASAVVSPPGPPFPSVKDITKSAVSLAWKVPDTDGGSKIKGYHVEMQEGDSEEWIKATKHDQRSCEFVVPDLPQGKKYNFRVMALNAAGQGEPGYIAEPVIIQEKQEMPEISLNVSVKEKIVVKAGGVINIPLYVTGRPSPTVSWEKDNKELPEEARVGEAGGSRDLVIRNCTREHSGKYTVIAKNDAGEKRLDIEVLVQDVPGVCGGPINPSNVTRDTIGFSWSPPEDDGGCTITNYVLEKRESSRRSWTRVSMTVTRTSAVVQGLIEGESYMFRVSAENILGVGPGIETMIPITARDPVSEPGRTEELRVTDVTRSTVSLAWKPPKSDGGLPISEYLVEKRLVGQERQWVRVTKELINESRYTVTGLFESNEYEFRVAAENSIGIGAKCLPSKQVKAEDPVLVPGPAVNPQVKSISKNTVTVTWQKPRHDGGAPVLGYIVETQKAGSEAWKIWCTQETQKTTSYTVPDLTENYEYRIRVTAVNKAGLSEPAFVKGTSTIIKDVLEEPEIDLDGFMLSTVTYRVGQTVKLTARIKGRPEPEVEWFKDGQGVDFNKYNVQRTAIGTELIRKESERTDSGVYTLKAKNTAGEKSVKINVNVLDKPGMCRNLKTILVRAGTDLILRASMAGRPVPVAVWKLGDVDLFKVARSSIKTTEDETRLTISNATRADCGHYVVTATNKTGSDSASAQVNVLDKPAACVGPLKIISLNKDRCTVAWEPPADNGGCEITNYTLEKCETSRMVWSVVTASVTACAYPVPRLLEGNEYIFRVKAENKMGLGPAIESSPVVAKSPYDKPGAPSAPEITKIGNGTATIAWKAPDKDGGRDIFGYYVEKREKKGVRWSPCNTKSIMDRRLNVLGLSIGYDYQFRVAAENEMGVGEPSEPSKMVTIKEPTEVPGPPSNPKNIEIKAGSTLRLLADVKGRPKPTVKWTKLGATLSRRADVDVTDLKTTLVVPETNRDDSGKYTLTASNAKGSKSANINVKPAEAPKITLPKELKVRSGQKLVVEAEISGKPHPVTYWMRKGVELEESEKLVDIKTSDWDTTLLIPNCNRDDSGKYILNVENTSGVKSTTVIVRVQDTPGPPGPIIIKEVTLETVSIAWESPINDGGSTITSYVIEKRESTRKAWATVTAQCSRTSWTINKLETGKSYYFRVMAENEYGIGIPFETPEPVKI
uniref:Titin n=1 Tax=Ciona savignyi TaxID=51511 RepID=H2YLF6_CIOSA